MPASSSDRSRIGRIGDWNNSNGGGSSSNPGGGRGFATLGSLGGGGGPSSRPRDDSDDDEEENENKGETYYAGGERSGVSVQGPAGRSNPPPGAGDLVRDLLRQAAAGGQARPEQPRSTAFFGGGHTLGSEDVESTFVPDPHASREDDTLYRTITLWRQGFQIEDGELMRYDVPRNAEILAQINAGNAPRDVIGAREGQPVELRVSKRTHEDYVPPQGPRAFIGSGNRLGAPVPNAPSSESTAMPGGFSSDSPAPPASGGDRQSINTRFEVDQSLPTTSIQIRLADGTRMIARMNLTHTVGDIRNFINASRPENLTRSYTIGTTFPNRILENDTETVEAAKLQNSVIVQRWA